MSINYEYLVYGAIFVAVFLFVEGIYLAAFGRSIKLNSRVSRRLDLLQKTGGSREQVLEQLRKEMGQHMRGRGIPLYSVLAEKAQKGAIAFSPTQLMMIMGVVAVFVFVALTLGTQTGIAVRAVLAPVAGVGIVYMWVNKKAKARTKLIEDQLADAIELMVRSLKVGHPFASAVGVVSKEVADPLGTEFGIIADEAQYGRDIAEALSHMADRLDVQDLKFLAVAVAIQQQSGGNLAEILENLAQVVRLRYRLFRRVAAITSEARFSGWFLSFFPLAALAAINLLDPDYFGEVKDIPAFVPAAIIALALMVLNIVVMKKLTDIRV